MNWRALSFSVMVISGFYLLTGSGQMNATEITRTVLDNGMTVLVQERHSAPVVAINTFVKAGYFNEPDSLTGISHLLEHMFFKGTEKRKVGELRDETKYLGGYLNGGTIYEYTHYYTILPSRSFREGLDIQSDALWNSLVDSAELDKEKQVVIQEVKRKLDNPDALSWEKLMELAFDSHPIRRWRMGTPQQIEGWSRDQLYGYYKNLYRPDNIILAVVGDVETKTVLEEVRKYYGGIKVQQTKMHEVPAEFPRQEFKCRQMNGDITITYLKMGFHIPGQLHPDYFALDVLAHILGQGRSSRLRQLLVEEKRLASAISSSAFVLKDFGMFNIEAELEAKDLLAAEQEIFKELDKIKNQSVSDQELTKAKNAISFAYLSSIETVEGLSTNLAFFELYGDYKLGEKYLEGVSRVTADDIRRVASEYLVLDKASIVEYRPHDQADEKMDAARLKKAIAEVTEGKGEKTESEMTGSPEVESSPNLVDVSQTTASEESPVQKEILPCGTTLISKKNPFLPLVSVGIFFKGGRVGESKENEGITRLTLETTLKGTKNKTAEEIFNSLDILGASLEAEAEADYFGYHLKVLSVNLDPALEIIADIMKEPVFAPEELEKEKELLLSKIEKSKDDMVGYPIRLFYQTNFPDHPYGFPEWGSEEAISNTGQEQVWQWHQRYFSADNMTVVVVGDFDSSVLKQQLDRLFGDFRGNNAAKLQPADLISISTENTLVETRNKAQTAQAVGFMTCPYRDEDYYPLKALQFIASGTGGRFFYQLREKRGLAYTVYGVNDSWDQNGAFYAYIATSPENEELARTELINEFYKFKTDLVDDQELVLSKNYISGMYQIILEPNSVLMKQYAKAYLIGKGIQDVEQYPEKINQVTKEQIKDVAAKYFVPENLRVGVVRGEK